MQTFSSETMPLFNVYLESDDFFTLASHESLWGKSPTARENFQKTYS
jgi:hypothetical protein